MDDERKLHRILAVQRSRDGEDPVSICASPGRSRAWPCKWIRRYHENQASWADDRSRCHSSYPMRTPAETEEIVKMVRLDLYNQALFCGARAILWEMEEPGVKPLPSVRTISRILSRNELAHRRTGKYKPKGTLYPILPSSAPDETRKAGPVGPCYLKVPVRFFSLSIVDTATVRCGLHPCLSRSAQTILDGLWGIWKLMGIPERIQVDNAMPFFVSPTHPSGMGPLIRISRPSMVHTDIRTLEGRDGGELQRPLSADAAAQGCDGVGGGTEVRPARFREAP